MGSAQSKSLPRVADRLIRRPLLESRLNEWAPLTVVRGPRGHGKTTAVALWLDGQQDFPLIAVWVTARPTTEDQGGFERCLAGSLRRAGLLVPEGFLRDGLVELGSLLLAESSDRKFVLVIDNFDLIRDERTLTELAGLVERHRHFHLVVCCQGHHPIDSLVAGMIKVNVIEPKELLLGLDETVELARAMGSNLDRAGAERLNRAVAGCISMARTALDDGPSGQIATTEDYALTQLSREVRDDVQMAQLMRFSLAELITWPLFRDLCDDPDPRRALDGLEATGLVGRIDDGDEVLFRISAPFRDILQDRYSADQPEEARAFHRRLGGWFAAHSHQSHVPIAFHHAVSGSDWDLADQLWSEHLLTMVRFDPLLLGRTLNRIPTDVLASRPSMQVARDISRVAIVDSDADGRRATLRAFAEACTRLVKQQWDSMPANELLILATGYLIELRLLGRLQVASHPRCKRATGVGSFKSYQLTKEDPHPCHDEYLPSRPSAHRLTTCFSPATSLAPSWKRSAGSLSGS